MSFILEALKKSENKRRGKSERRSTRSIHEPTPQNRAGSRFRFLGITFVLFMNAVLLFWFLGPWRQPGPEISETLITDSRQLKNNINESDSVQMSPSELQSNSAPFDPVSDNQTQKSQGQVKSAALPVPRSEKQVYHFSQLPVAIQKRIPELRMSLHAFNRSDATASMVQLNDRMMREKDMVTADISLERITSDGVILRYDGYRFLVPRRSN
ncbi:general secretion pathway protein GspB [uncultured Desulfuromusa sp.]|uniref:general secretion pathway protein GspB n=1 Tax=uncultured Desulfuromusa sp. TaxID=219183 RepID=UPI002AA74977|nr:general secretion pathway protein GspB [uncultured Desulfuromusa sp.]